MTAPSLLIACPKELIRAGLRAMLAKSPVRIVGEATDARSTLTLAKKLKPAVVLLDVLIPGGDAFDLPRNLSKTQPATNFLYLAAIENPTYMARARAAGAYGFLLEGVTQKELIAAIVSAAAGKMAMATGGYARVSATMDIQPAYNSRGVRLTPRESQVLRHVAHGLSNEEIAKSMGISIETVKEHVQQVLRKLAVRDRTQAAVWAVQAGVV